MKLDEYLKKHGLTQEKFAEKVKVSRVQITKFINRQRNPSVHLMKRIQDVTKGEVSFDDLFIPELPSRLKDNESK